MKRFFSIETLNKEILELWKQPKTPKPDINKLTQEMLKDPQYKDKVWIPFTAQQVAEHLSNYRNIKEIKDNETNGNGC